jgi:GrpB-like predicted nucleotidyltransferase (UPF0157 family)
MILAPHNPDWSTKFEALRQVYLAALSDLILRVEHVGSTAVPNLAAKPILDIDMVMQGYDVFPKIVVALGALGYTHTGDQGIVHREAFKPHDGTVPLTSPRRQWMRHHLFVCPVQSVELRRHIVFRDALRARADWREEYEQMKRDIANRSHGDRKVYAQIKEVECRAFVESVLTEASNHSLERTAGKLAVAQF